MTESLAMAEPGRGMRASGRVQATQLIRLQICNLLVRISMLFRSSFFVPSFACYWHGRASYMCTMTMDAIATGNAVIHLHAHKTPR